MGHHQPVPPEPDHDVALPGSGGEHALQRHAGSQDRAHRFYRQQVLGRLNERMVEFIGRQEMVWIATADGHGECDCSFRAGPPGFVQVLDPWTMRYPEFRTRDLHPLPQAPAPAGQGGRPGAALGHRRPSGQGRRLLRGQLRTPALGRRLTNPSPRRPAGWISGGAGGRRARRR
jgi:hypothetical protein